MIRYIIVSLVVFILIALLAMWIVSGGPRKVAVGTKDAIVGAVPGPDDMVFKLPWQPPELLPTIDLADAFDLAPGDDEDLSPQEKLVALEAEYDRLNAEASQARTFGTPSPFAGKITIVHDPIGVRAEDVRDEYVQVAANYANTDTIDIAGWTIESALSGTRVMIPPGATPFIANSANILGPVGLEPGGLALVATAPSPVGVSFRENRCTGYLAQFQEFSPPLSEECPAPPEVLPLNTENLQRYGDACFDAVADLPACRFPQNLPNTVSSACYSYLTQFLSYNGCMNKERFRSSFQKNMWRVYLGASGELWRNSHDAIRLLDSEGRTVSVYVY